MGILDFLGWPGLLGSDAPAVDKAQPAPMGFDWSRYNQPTGEMKAATYTPTQRMGNAAAEGLMALGMQPYTAHDLTNRVGNVLAASPLGIPGAAADTLDAQMHGDNFGVVQGMAGMFPGVGPEARAAAKIIRGGEDTASRMARAKAMGFRTDMPLYHGTGNEFSSFQAVPTTAAGMETPGVSLALDPELANLFAENSLAKGGGQDVRPQVYPLLHRAERPVSLALDGSETHGAVVGTLRNAFEAGHDAVMLKNYTAGGTVKPQNIIIVRDANQLRSPYAAFDPAKKFDPNLLAGIAGLSIVPAAGFEIPVDYNPRTNANAL
jgi:hypothetical protein